MPDRLFEWRAKDALFYLYTAVDIRTAVSFCSVLDFTCGGVRVEPGDFVLADFEGVVAVPAAIADEVHRLAMEKLEGESTVRDELEAGASPREVFDKYGIL